MELEIWDILLGLLTILSAIWAFISEEYRLVAIVLSFILVTIIIISKQNTKIFEVESQQKRTLERLKIYEMLVDIKSDIKQLQKEVKELQIKVFKIK